MPYIYARDDISNFKNDTAFLNYNKMMTTSVNSDIGMQNVRKSLFYDWNRAPNHQVSKGYVYLIRAN